jgi:hypothetical protein
MPLKRLPIVSPEAHLAKLSASCAWNTFGLFTQAAKVFLIIFSVYLGNKDASFKKNLMSFKKSYVI